MPSKPEPRRIVGHERMVDELRAAKQAVLDAEALYEMRATQFRQDAEQARKPGETALLFAGTDGDSQVSFSSRTKVFAEADEWVTKLRDLCAEDTPRFGMPRVQLTPRRGVSWLAFCNRGWVDKSGTPMEVDDWFSMKKVFPLAKDFESAIREWAQEHGREVEVQAIVGDAMYQKPSVVPFPEQTGDSGHGQRADVVAIAA